MAKGETVEQTYGHSWLSDWCCQRFDEVYKKDVHLTEATLSRKPGMHAVVRFIIEPLENPDSVSRWTVKG